MLNLLLRCWLWYWSCRVGFCLGWVFWSNIACLGCLFWVVLVFAFVSACSVRKLSILAFAGVSDFGGFGIWVWVECLGLYKTEFW